MVNEKFVEINHFYEELTSDQRQLLDLLADQLMLVKGKFLFHEGEIHEYMYVILSGKVKMVKKSPNGKDFSIHLKQNGDLIGESILFNTQPSSMSAIIIENTTVLRLSKSTIERLFRQNGDIALLIMKYLARQTQSTQAKFRDLVMSGKTGAMYSTLIRFSHSYGIKIPDGVRINIYLTNSDIAQFIGSSRESVNRMLSDLKKSKVLDIVDGYIEIYDLNYLKSMLGCGSCSIDICTI